MKFGRFLRWLFKPLFFLIYPYKVYGKENIPDAKNSPPLMICSNHISILDPAFIIMISKRPVYFMAKEELFPNKIAKWFFTGLFGAFPVSRGKGGAEAVEKSIEIIKRGDVMGIYPEGTRSRDGKLGRVKSGAALIASQSNAHILPVAMVAKNQTIKPFRRTKIIFGKTISPEDLNLDDPDKPDLRFASREIMSSISSLIETQDKGE